MGMGMSAGRIVGKGVEAIPEHPTVDRRSWSLCLAGGQSVRADVQRRGGRVVARTATGCRVGAGSERGQVAVLLVGGLLALLVGAFVLGAVASGMARYRSTGALPTRLPAQARTRSS